MCIHRRIFMLVSIHICICMYEKNNWRKKRPWFWEVARKCMEQIKGRKMRGRLCNILLKNHSICIHVCIHIHICLAFPIDIISKTIGMVLCYVTYSSPDISASHCLLNKSDIFFNMEEQSSREGFIASSNNILTFPHFHWHGYILIWEQLIQVFSVCLFHCLEWSWQHLILLLSPSQNSMFNRENKKECVGCLFRRKEETGE